VFVLGNRRMRRAMALLLAAGSLMPLATAASATTSRGALATTDYTSYLAQGPGDLQLAVVVHGRRILAYACDGRTLRAFFSGLARRGPVTLTSAGGAHRLGLRVGRRQVQATLKAANAAPVRLTARRARAAIFGVRISPTGSVIGTAAGGGVLGAQLSANGLAGALALPGQAPTGFQAPDVATTPPFADGVSTPLPLDRLGESMAGDWRWIVTSRGFIGGGTRTVTGPGNVPVVSTLGKRGVLETLNDGLLGENDDF
jgi:hypothetical protein